MLGVLSLSWPESHTDRHTSGFLAQLSIKRNVFNLHEGLLTQTFVNRDFQLCLADP